MLTTVITSLLGYLYWATIAHLYTPREVGSASAAIAALLLATNLSASGLGAMLLQRLPACRDDRERATACYLSLTIAIACGALSAVPAAFLLQRALPSGAFDTPSIYALFVAGVPAGGAGMLADAILIAERAPALMLVRNIAASLLKLPLMTVPALLAHGGPEAIVLSWVASSAIATGAVLRWALPHARPEALPALSDWLREARQLPAIFVGQQAIGLGGMAWMYLLPMTVAARLSAADAAYSGTVWLTGGMLFMISSAASTAFVAEAARDEERSAPTLRAGLALTAALLAPGMLCMAIAGPHILALFGGSYARRGASLLILLAAAAIPDAITNFAVAALRVRRRLAEAAMLNVGMAALALALAWWWLPPMGICGAGWAWLVAQSAGCGWAFRALRRHRGPATRTHGQESG